MSGANTSRDAPPNGLLAGGSQGGAPSSAHGSSQQQQSGGANFAAVLGTMNVLHRFRGTGHQPRGAGIRGQYYLHMAPKVTGSTGPPPGIPVREILQQIFITKRDNTIYECAIYFLYVVVFVSVIYQIHDSKAINSANQALQNYFVTQQFPIQFSTAPKTFNDIGQYSELTQWMQGVFIPNLFNTNFSSTQPQWYNNGPMSPAEQRYLIAGEYYKMLGGVRLWQARVTNTSCASPLQKSAAFIERFARPGGACYSAYDAVTTADSAPFVIDPATQASNSTYTPNPHVYAYVPEVVDPNGVVVGLSGWGVPMYGQVRVLFSQRRR